MITFRLTRKNILKLVNFWPNFCENNLSTFQKIPVSTNLLKKFVDTVPQRTCGKFVDLMGFGWKFVDRFVISLNITILQRTCYHHLKILPQTEIKTNKLLTFLCFNCLFLFPCISYYYSKFKHHQSTCKI